MRPAGPLALTLALCTFGSLRTAAAKDPPGTPPEVISWFRPAEVQAQLQGTWKLGGDRLVIEGSRVTSTNAEGQTATFTLKVHHPGRVSFEEADGGAVNYAFAANGSARYLYTGTAGMKRGDQYVVGDGWAGMGVVVFDAAKKACTAVPLSFDEWGPPAKVECALGEEGGHPVLRYSYPDPTKSQGATVVLKRDQVYVVGDALLDSPKGEGALEPEKR